MAEQYTRCISCAAVLTGDEIAMTRKMINRGATEFFCLHCLAEHFRVSEDVLRQKIAEFKAMGCTLFGENALEKDTE